MQTANTGSSPRQLTQVKERGVDHGREEWSKFHSSVYGSPLTYADVGHNVIKSELCVPKAELCGVWDLGEVFTSGWVVRVEMKKAESNFCLVLVLLGIGPRTTYMTNRPYLLLQETSQGMRNFCVTENVVKWSDWVPPFSPCQACLFYFFETA